MFLDASAVVAIIADEPQARALLSKIDLAESRFHTSPIAIWEATAALARIMRVSTEMVGPIVDRFHSELRATCLNITPEMAVLALNAFDRYGKPSGHPAGLNMGDCFSYAAAKTVAVPILYIGNDFSQTDIG